MSVRRMQLVSWLSKNKLEAVVEMSEDGKPIGRMTLDAAGLEELMHSLAGLRERMTDIVPFNLDPGSRFRSVRNPSWRLRPQRDASRALFVRHPGFGWMAFRFPDEEAERLSAGLKVKLKSSSDPSDEDEPDRP
jgi:hypothetical protein